MSPPLVRDPSLVLVQPRKTCPCLTERLLIGRKESNQTKTLVAMGVLPKKSAVCSLVLVTWNILQRASKGTEFINFGL